MKLFDQLNPIEAPARWRIYRSCLYPSQHLPQSGGPITSSVVNEWVDEQVKPWTLPTANGLLVFKPPAKPGMEEPTNPHAPLLLTCKK